MNLFTKIGTTIKNAFSLTNREIMDIEEAFRPKDNTIKELDDKLEPCECDKEGGCWHIKFNEETGKSEIVEGAPPREVDAVVEHITNNIDMDIITHMKSDCKNDNLDKDYKKDKLGIDIDIDIDLIMPKCKKDKPDIDLINCMKSDCKNDKLDSDIIKSMMSECKKK